MHKNIIGIAGFVFTVCFSDDYFGFVSNIFFLVGFYVKYVKGKAIFWGAAMSQLTIFFIYYFAIHIYPSGQEKLGYLWLNFIGAVLTLVFSVVLQMIFRDKNPEEALV